MFALLLAALVAVPANAADEPGLWTRQAVGTSGWPAGLISDTRMQYRAPLARKEGSWMLNETYAGVGGMARITPAFVEFGPRLSIAPVDVFDLDLQASRLQYFNPGLGLMPFESSSEGGKLDGTRSDRAANGEGVASGGWSFTATPTFKLQLGPIVAFDTWNISFLALDKPDNTSEDFVYEPYRDQVVAWNDVSIEHQAALLYTVLPGDDGPMFWVGGTVRDRFNHTSDDRSTAAGALIVAKPGTSATVPKIVGQAMFYVKDQDRVGTVPNLQLLAAWTFE